MSLYETPKFHLPKIKIACLVFFKKRFLWKIVLIVFVSSLCGFVAGAVSGSFFYLELKDYLSGLPGIEKIIEKEYLPQTTQEQAIVDAVNETSPAVVSIVITKDMPVFEKHYLGPYEEFFDIPQYRQIGTQKQEVGGGTGFIVSADGIVLTNKHVVLDEEADYTVLTNDGKKFQAKVLARDPLQDLAILKIETEKTINEQGNLVQQFFPVVRLGDSDKLQIGQTVIAIGNALGEFRNTVSVGVISGLGRTITAEGGGLVETIEDVIQTDAAINKGNSGGPLLNLKGEVIGINTATVLDAASIGFTIPVNKAKKDIDQIKSSGRIVYPYLGVYYTLITEELQKEFDLPVGYGVWVGRDASGGKTDSAVVAGTPAEKAGLQRDDIILEFNNEKITSDNSLAKILQKYNPNDQVTLKILRNKEEKMLACALGEREK